MPSSVCPACNGNKVIPNPNIDEDGNMECPYCISDKDYKKARKDLAFEDERDEEV